MNEREPTVVERPVVPKLNTGGNVDNPHDAPTSQPGAGAIAAKPWGRGGGIAFFVLLTVYSLVCFFLMPDDVAAYVGAIGFMFSVLIRFFAYKKDTREIRLAKMFGDIVATTLLATVARGIMKLLPGTATEIVLSVMIIVFCAVAASVFRRDLD